jgi:predicted choloylglycine hydrolase
MQLHFNAVSEPCVPGKKWQKLYHTHWEAYKAWLISKGNAYEPDLKTSQEALKKYMPEMWTTYERLCKLANADDVAARFLTGFQPPAYISACSNAVLSGEEIQLVRNYDYHPNLMEGTQLLSAWNGKKVITTSDCLFGAVDGMNEDGLAISLTFGGRKEVGVGFGIPFILRYVLEFCSNVEEAVAALVRIPSHMSYNVTVVDKTGAFKTVQLAPDKKPVVTDAAFTTNYQGTVDWPENAAFNKTLERSAFLEKMLAKKDLKASAIADAFLQKPLHNTKFKEGFGTLFTAVYQPANGVVDIRWPDEKVTQTFEDFQEQYKLIQFQESVIGSKQDTAWASVPSLTPKKTPQEAVLPKTSKSDWQATVTETIVNTMTHSSNSNDREESELLRDSMVHRGEISWEIVADYWANIGKSYGEKWQK